MFVCLFFMHFVSVRVSATELRMAYPFVQGKAGIKSPQSRDGWARFPQFSKNRENLSLIIQKSRRIFYDFVVLPYFYLSTTPLDKELLFDPKLLLPMQFVISLLKRYSKCFIQETSCLSLFSDYLEDKRR